MPIYLGHGELKEGDQVSSLNGLGVAACLVYDIRTDLYRLFVHRVYVGMLSREMADWVRKAIDG